MPDPDLLNRIASDPIPGDNPAGESPRYDEAFTRLEAEIAKLENPAGGAVDWRAVEEGAGELLTGRSKDLLVAAWMVRAMWQREGLPGLAAGVRMLHGMCSSFWEPLHPQRLKPRRAALEWLGEKLAAAIEDGQLEGDPAGAADGVAAIGAMAEWLQGRFEGEDSGLTPLLVRLRAAPQPPAAEPTAADGDSAGDAGARPAGRAAGPAGPAGPIASRAQAMARLRELADWWQAHEPSSPMVPLLRRAVVWSELDFQALFQELLRNRSDAKDYLWDVLGIVDPPPQG